MPLTLAVAPRYLTALFVAFLISFAVVAETRTAAAAEPVAVPGTRVSLVPPAGFALSDQFSGFYNSSTGASIVVSELPAQAYAQFSARFGAGTTGNGMTFTAREDTTVGTFPGFILRGTQVLNGATWDKWLLAFGTPDFTAFVTLNALQTVAFSEDAAIAALNSTVTLSNTNYDPKEALPFDFEESARFDLDRVMQHRARLTSTNNDGAIFIVEAPSTEVCDLLELGPSLVAESLLRSIRSLTISHIGESRPVTVDGMSGLEYVAEAVDKGSLADLAVYQTVVFEDCRYYRFLGTAPRDKGELYRADFQQMTQSFERKR